MQALLERSSVQITPPQTPERAGPVWRETVTGSSRCAWCGKVDYDPKLRDDDGWWYHRNCNTQMHLSFESEVQDYMRRRTSTRRLFASRWFKRKCA